MLFCLHHECPRLHTHSPGGTKRVINDINQQIKDLILANLWYDVQLIDPVQELKRLYPSSTPQVSVGAATVALYVHHAATR